MPTLTSNGFGAVVRQQNSGIEGAFGLGFVLGTNLTLDVQTVVGTRVQRNTAYSLSYTDPSNGKAIVISLLHDPSVPYQNKLPNDTDIVLSIPESATYYGLDMTFQIPPNTFVVKRIRLAFRQGASKVGVRNYFS